MVQILPNTKLVVTRNQSRGHAMQINGPVGTGDFVVFEETNITENIAEDFATQMNHPVSKEVQKDLNEGRVAISKNKAQKQGGSRTAA